MSQNYFEKLIRNIKKVYKLDVGLKSISDSQINPDYQTDHVLSLILFGFLLRIKSYNELNSLLKSNDFHALHPRGTKLPGLDIIRNTLKVLDLCNLRLVNNSIVYKAFRNKIFDKGTIDKYTEAAIDGIKFFRSNKKSCEMCLKSVNHNYHSGVVMSLIGNEPRLVVDFEMINPKQDSLRKDEGELTASKRLISRFSKQLKRKVDVVAYDALACNSLWIKHLIGLNINAVVRVKKNNNRSLRDAKQRLNKSEPVEVCHLDDNNV